MVLKFPIKIILEGPGKSTEIGWGFRCPITEHGGEQRQRRLCICYKNVFDVVQYFLSFLCHVPQYIGQRRIIPVFFLQLLQVLPYIKLSFPLQNLVSYIIHNKLENIKHILHILHYQNVDPDSHESCHNQKPMVSSCYIYTPDI